MTCFSILRWKLAYRGYSWKSNLDCMSVVCGWPLVHFRKYILRSNYLVCSFTDLHIVTRVLSADNSISFLEVDFLKDSFFICTARTNSDDLIQRWSFLIWAIRDDDTWCSYFFSLHGLEEYSIGEGSEPLDHVMGKRHMNEELIIKNETGNNTRKV